MAVRQIKSEKKCKLCRSEKRDEIDALLELRSDAGKLPDGSRATLKTITPLIESLGVEHLTKENITGHWKNHCQVIGAETMKAVDAAVNDALASLEAGGRIDPDTALDRIILLGMAEVEAKVANGQLSGIPPDLVLKAIDSKTRRNNSEAAADLMRGVGHGLAAAFAGGLKPIQAAPKEIEEEIIEGEFKDAF